MNKYELFDELAKNDFIAYCNGKKLVKDTKDNFNFKYIDEEDLTVKFIVSGHDVFCGECDEKFSYRDGELVNEKTLKLYCFECGNEVEIRFLNLKQIPRDPSIKNLLEGSVYEILLNEEVKHAIYKNSVFYCIEEEDKEVVPERINKEVFLSGAEIARLRLPEKEEVRIVEL